MTFSRLFCAVLVVAGSLGLFLGTPNPVFHVPGAVLVYPACLFLAAESGIPAWHVESAAELLRKNFHEKQTVGLTAGASTPKRLINEAQAWLEAI